MLITEDWGPFLKGDVIYHGVVVRDCRKETDMTEETTTEAEDTRSPMEKAVANGYQEEAAPTRDERAAALVDAMEHAVKHNAPVTLAMVAELRDLLGVVKEEERAAAELPGDANVSAA